MTTSAASQSHIIRRRHRVGLKPFDYAESGDYLFDDLDARHDRIKIALRVDISVPANIAPQYAEVVDNRDGSGVDVLRLRRKPGDQWAISIARDAWLFACMGNLAALHHEGHFRASITLDLNPTRFWSLRESSNLSDLEELSPEEALAFDPEKSRIIKAQTLDGNDNCLIGNAKLGGSTFGRRSERWRRILQIYLQKVELLLRSALAPEDAGAQIIHFSYGAVRQAEIYWELFHPDAIVAVSGIAKSLKRSDGSAILANLPILSGGSANSEWVRLPLSKDASLTVYAKTSTRLRWEIKYQDGLAEDARRYAGVLTGNIVSVLMAGCCGAGRRMRNIWSYFLSALAFDVESSEIFTFMSKLNSAVPEKNRHIVLSLLGTRRNITATGSEGIAPPSVCKALVRSGVLRPARLRNRGRVYALAPQFDQMFDQLFRQS